MTQETLKLRMASGQGLRTQLNAYKSYPVPKAPTLYHRSLVRQDASFRFELFNRNRCRLGLVILPSFLSAEKQRDLVRWSLSEHSRHPNETNLDIHYVLPKGGLWNAYLRARSDPEQNLLIQPRASGRDSQPILPSGPRELVNNTPASPESFKEILTTPKLPQTPSPTVQPTSISSLIYKLRWANIGWYYHWGTKQYDFTKGPGVINDELRSICKQAVESVNWEKVHGSSNADWGPEGPNWDAWDQTYGAWLLMKATTS